MKKYLKKIFIILGFIILIIFLDTFQALVFNNSPIFKIRIQNEGSLTFIDHGLLVDTYHCKNNKKDTVLKGFSYSCSIDADYEIIDTSKNIKDFACAEALEEIYKDSDYTYYLSCIKSKYIIVDYKDKPKENIIDALKNNHITINDLDKFNIDYLKYPNEKDKLDKISMIIKEGTLTKIGATIVITDLSGKDNVYGEEFQILKNENNKWIELKPIIDNYAFNAIGYSVDLNNQLEMDINWEWLYGSLENGEYRLVKKVYFKEDKKNYSINVDFKID